MEKEKAGKRVRERERGREKERKCVYECGRGCVARDTCGM